MSTQFPRRRDIFNRSPYFASVPPLLTLQFFFSAMTYYLEHLKFPGKHIFQKIFFAEQIPVTTFVAVTRLQVF